MLNERSYNNMLIPALKNGSVTHPIAHLPFLLHNNEEKVHSKHQPVPLQPEYRKHI